MAYIAGTNVATGDVLTASKWNQDVIANDAALYNSLRRIGYQTRTTAYTTTSGVAPGPANIFTTSISWTADGTSAYLCEFYASSVTTATNAGAFIVITMTTDSGTAICTLIQNGFGDGTRACIQPQFGRYWYTPAAGTATLNIRAYHGVAAGTVDAGSGGSSAAPMYVAVYGPALA